jgi:hypothetical protein
VYWAVVAEVVIGVPCVPKVRVPVHPAAPIEKPLTRGGSLANKMARTAWSLLAHQSAYREDYVARETA